MQPLPRRQLEAGLDHIRHAPREAGTVEMIVRRPGIGEREVVAEAELALDQGLVGDNWRVRGSRTMPDGGADPGRQVTVMNARCIDVVAGDRNRWSLAGDQLYVDFDLSVDHLPPRTRLQLGSAVIEVSQDPHTGCGKFMKRFGADALRFVNSPEGRRLRLRGMNARVVVPGMVRVGGRVERR